MNLEMWRADLVRGLTGRVLELGVRNGPNFAHYPTDIQLVATDVTAASMRGARQHFRGLRQGFGLSVADAQCLPFADASFDTVVATLVFCSIPNPGLALAEIRRVLKPHGELRTIDHVRSPQPVIGAVMDILAPAYKVVAQGCNLNRRTEDVLRSAGYTIQQQRRAIGGIMRLFIAIPSAIPES